MFIDPTQGPHGVIYVEARTAPSGVGAFFHGLHKLDLTTGVEMSDGPSVINATIAGNGCDSVNGTVSFNSAAQNNRSALLYANGVVYVSSTRRLWAFDAATGALLWHGEIGGPGSRYSSPAVVDGRVYVGSLDGGVYAFALPAKLRAR